MRRIPLAVISVSLVLATVGSVSPAVAARYCLRGSHWGYPGNCQFSTLQQCRAAASGTSSYCGINPRHAFARQQRGRE
ncbi:DUF3551 domain-containing protein [Bradyrhizobium sp. ARR65]|uniref:DUF3551 domain-containing protein n=1 Tax=Bradyrhizobium sp. ARR65 TaxID=1040989 RepID=UPI000A035ECA|nr:DUF3551 domain-containing protein [Bradyrhizobium sp. ARR65]